MVVLEIRAMNLRLIGAVRFTPSAMIFDGRRRVQYLPVTSISTAENQSGIYRIAQPNCLVLKESDDAVEPGENRVYMAAHLTCRLVEAHVLQPCSSITPT